MQIGKSRLVPLSVPGERVNWAVQLKQWTFENGFTYKNSRQCGRVTKCS